MGSEKAALHDKEASAVRIGFASLQEIKL